MRSLHGHYELALDALCIFLCKTQESFRDFFIFKLIIVQFILLYSLESLIKKQLFTNIW